MNAEPPRDLFRRQELLVGGITGNARLWHGHCDSCVGRFYERHLLCVILPAQPAKSIPRARFRRASRLASEDPERTIKQLTVARVVEPTRGA